MTVRTASSPYVCGWTLDDECCAKLKNAFDTEATAVMAQLCVDQAAEILYSLSGRQFGACEVTARPCRELCFEPRQRYSSHRWTPLLMGGEWFNIACGCRSSCSCTQICEVSLPGPVAEITSIRLDGVVLSPSEYRIDNRRQLVRTSGGCWPICQNMNLDADQPGTWEVSYTRGRPLPAAGQAALGALACELCKACIGDKECGLPERVTTIVRQGLTMAMLDPMEFLTKGRTGVYAVDIWLAAVNPRSRPRHAGVFSPDLVAPRVKTWP